MKVGIIGSGGREHALCYAIKKSKKVEKIFCLPGNAGTHEIADNIDLNLSRTCRLSICDYYRSNYLYSIFNI